MVECRTAITHIVIAIAAVLQDAEVDTVATVAVADVAVATVTEWG